ncbi:MAG: branched-chain amino acid ABC transporter permease [Dongiaceae bacterium]
MIFLLLALGPMLVTAIPSIARAEIDPFYDAQKICRDFLPGFVAAPFGLERDPVQWTDDGHTLIAWQWEGDRLASSDSAGWLACWFLPLQQSGGRWQIARLESAKYGLMTRYDVQQLYKLLHILPAARADEDDTATHYGVGYVLQQSVNALALGCLYALVAVAFTLIYAAGRFINFAFGPLVMLGAFMLFLTRGLAGSFDFGIGLGGTAAGFVLAIAAVGVPAAAFGWAMAILFRPLEARPLAAMIAAIGLAIAISEAMRLLQGPQTQWMPFYPDSGVALGNFDGFGVVASPRHLTIGLATGLVAAGLHLAGRYTKLGRKFRAAVEDSRMAALLGINGGRMVALGFAVGGFLAGLAGAFSVWHYGPVDFGMGMPFGFKALTAAVLGGLGSVPGAFLGGLAVAAVETLAASVVGGAWRDVVVFGLLAGILILRSSKTGQNRRD